MIEEEYNSRNQNDYEIYCADCGSKMLWHQAAEMAICLKCTDQDRWKISDSYKEKNQ